MEYLALNLTPLTILLPHISPHVRGCMNLAHRSRSTFLRKLSDICSCADPQTPLIYFSHARPPPMMLCWLDGGNENLDKKQVDKSDMDMVNLHQFLHFQR